MKAITVPNFYDPNQTEITIPLNPRLLPQAMLRPIFAANKAKKTKVAVSISTIVLR